MEMARGMGRDPREEREREEKEKEGRVVKEAVRRGKDRSPF